MKSSNEDIDIRSLFQSTSNTICPLVVTLISPSLLDQSTLSVPLQSIFSRLLPHMSNGWIFLMGVQSSIGEMLLSLLTLPFIFILHPFHNRSRCMHYCFFVAFFYHVAKATPFFKKRNSFICEQGVPSSYITPNKQQRSHLDQQEKIRGVEDSHFKLALNPRDLVWGGKYWEELERASNASKIRSVKGE